MQAHPAEALKLPGSAVTIGAFDGVHRGHQALVGEAVNRARMLGVFERLGAEYAVVAHFDKAYAARSGESLLEKLSAMHLEEVWIGPDFRFGRDHVDGARR